MSIDYDRLRTTVGVVDDPETDKITRGNYTLALEVQGPALARELLRLRDGIETIRDRCATLAESARTTNISLLANLGYEMDINATALTDLLNGDTE